CEPPSSRIGRCIYWGGGTTWCGKEGAPHIPQARLLILDLSRSPYERFSYRYAAQSRKPCAHIRAGDVVSKRASLCRPCAVECGSASPAPIGADDAHLYRRPCFPGFRINPKSAPSVRAECGSVSSRCAFRGEWQVRDALSPFCIWPRPHLHGRILAESWQNPGRILAESWREHPLPPTR